MEIIDFNGVGRWSSQTIQQRYAQYACQLQVSPLELIPLEHQEEDRLWIYPMMFQIVDGMKKADKACIEIGLEFIEEDQRFRFGRVIKSNAARALRRSDLTPAQMERIRRRVSHMLVAEHVPREFKEYSKLLRKVGLGDWWPFIQEQANLNNLYVLRYYNYFSHHALSD